MAAGFKVATAIMVLALLVAVISGAGCSGAGGESKINWMHDWTAALERAQDQNKPLMIYFYTDMCPACRHLEENAFSDDELSSYLNSNLICLESSAERSTLHKKYGIGGTVPTTVFSKPDGYDQEYEIGRVVGSAPAVDFLQAAQTAVAAVQG